jgi:Histidinol-phosphate/aromatic aminotransferase and cobyric acid decarboxylase
MKYSIEKRLLDLEPYTPVTGEFSVRSDANESFLPLPGSIISEFKEALPKIEYNRYPDAYCKRLCTAFGEAYSVDPGDVTVGNGSDELISLITETFLSDGAPLMTLSPDFSMYSFYTCLRRGKLIEYKKKDADAGEILKIIEAEKVEILIFSNPRNPTGKLMAGDTLLGIVENSPALVVVDEAYADFSGGSLLSSYKKYDNLIILKTLSKVWGAASLRLGFAVANPALTKILKAVKPPYNVNGVTQLFGEILLKNKRLYEEALRALVKSKDELFDGLKTIKRVAGADFLAHPSVTNFVYAETAAAKEICEYLKENGVSIRLLEGAVRISAGTKEENEKIIGLLRKFK